ncbi:MAG: type II toxin-antitoxin system HicB family antitoxin [Bacteroidetes bacterium]|nr:type II toxin-antitoxin system HicB family antitoxin [Bacteroidota bacterium]
MQINAIIEKDENGYFAFVPDLKGCFSQGETFEEALKNINEAAELYLESLTEKEKSELLAKSTFIASLTIQTLRNLKSV